MDEQLLCVAVLADEREEGVLEPRGRAEPKDTARP